MSDLIHVRELSKRFRRTVALENVSVSIQSPGMIGLVGKNGAGKTTFLALLAGALRATAGFVELLGLPVGHPGLLGKVGVLTQDSALRRGMPAYGQLLHLGGLTRADTAAVRRELDLLLEELGASAFAHGKPEVLSYGQRKRLGIAQALLGEPELLLLDEPTAGLDPAAAVSIREIIRRRATRAVVILSSHNLYEIEDFCSHVLVIDRGHMIHDSDIAGLTRDSNTLTIRLDRELDVTAIQLLSQLPEVTELTCDESMPDKFTVHVASPDINRVQLQVQSLLVEKGYGILGLSRGKTLADGVFKLLEDT